MPETTAQTAARLLAVEQDQVGPLLDRLTDAIYDGDINPLALERLLIMGHFMEYGHELDWSPRHVAGHLRDSARIFTDRIQRILAEDDPHLVDFVTDDPELIAEYEAAERDDLRDELDAAQAELRRTVAEVPEEALDRAGIHETDGRVTLRSILDFLPGHQSDHREQLAAFAAAPL